MTDRIDQAKALASETRTAILGWLREPRAHFSHQITGDPSEIGVCVTLLAEKAEMSQATISRHMDILRRAGFVSVNRVGKWAFFSRDENRISDYARWLANSL